MKSLKEKESSNIKIIDDESKIHTNMIQKRNKYCYKWHIMKYQKNVKIIKNN